MENKAAEEQSLSSRRAPRQQPGSAAPRWPDASAATELRYFWPTDGQIDPAELDGIRRGRAAVGKAVCKQNIKVLRCGYA